jgi:hypothetical protein
MIQRPYTIPLGNCDHTSKQECIQKEQWITFKGKDSQADPKGHLKVSGRNLLITGKDVIWRFIPQAS